MRPMIAALLCVAAFAASAQTYRWTDASGRVHYTNTPPPPGARDVQKHGKPATPAATDPDAAGQPFALQQAMKNFPITLYSTPGCEACGEARKLLNARGIPFKEVSIVEDSQIEELKKAVGSNSVPAMVVGRTVQKGFEEGAYHRVLDAAGYPKTGVLAPRNQGEPAPVQPGAAPVEPVAEPAPAGPYSTENLAPPPKR